MNRTLLYIFMSIGGIAGAYIPTIFGADGLGGWSIIGSTVGSIVGIFMAYRMSE